MKRRQDGCPKRVHSSINQRMATPLSGCLFVFSLLPPWDGHGKQLRGEGGEIGWKTNNFTSLQEADERKSERVRETRDGWMDGWMDRQMEGWEDGGTDELMQREREREREKGEYEGKKKRRGVKNFSPLAWCHDLE